MPPKKVLMKRLLLPEPGKSKDIKILEQTHCLVCEDETGSYEAVFCEGECQGWTHRQCAGITCLGYDKLGESAMPFFCTYCTLVKQRNEIDTLKDVMKTLSNKISAIEASQA